MRDIPAATCAILFSFQINDLSAGRRINPIGPNVGLEEAALCTVRDGSMKAVDMYVLLYFVSLNATFHVALANGIRV